MTLTTGQLLALVTGQLHATRHSDPKAAAKAARAIVAESIPGPCESTAEYIRLGEAVMGRKRDDCPFCTWPIHLHASKEKETPE